MNSGMAERRGRVERKTAETDIVLDVLIDGQGAGAIGTGIAFFDHMLKLFVRHSLVDLNVKARGDLMSISTIRSKTWAFVWDKRSTRHLAKRRGSDATVSFTFPWMRRSRVVVDFSGGLSSISKLPRLSSRSGCFHFNLWRISPRL